MYFNTEWNNEVPKEQQKTDRLLIHGDVSGITTIHFRNLLKGKKTKEKNTGPVNTRGLSLVQVSGKAEENSFKLANGYTTIKGLPYKYTLNAYGPTSSRGKASIEQSFVGEEEDFWDFRLQNAILDSEETISPDTQKTNFFDSEEITPLNTEETASLNDGETTPLYSKKAASPDAEETISSDTQETNFFDSEEITPLNTKETASLNDGETTPLYSKKAACLNAKGKVRALVPQVASYLVMPNALFSTGLAELNNQNILLENMRTTLFEAKDKKEDNKKSGIFLSSYGHKITLSSNRSPLHYGYGADVHYTAIQAGMTLAALEGQNSTTHFGLLGTYGKLSFTPKGMEGADKSTLDKWSLAAYGNIQHNDGIYVNALFSYGAFKGNITTALIGNTAKLDGSHTVSASATIGHKLETDAKGLVFEPQAQLLYQRLMLGTLSDVDGFNVNMGKPHQWLLRIGGRLTQTIPSDEKGYATSFYGKLNLMKAFSNKSTIQIGDTFYLDAMGDSVEGGLGVNAQLSQNFALHADINYQYKLQKAGVSGINFSAGMRYQF
ncbi:autotransporter outer membrane beta-barrel domain-containing protein [Bartonella henselae]|uniref:autotransporter outer membrane beta-barrel domain-containing protein n=1 Tax=Bartonella henselae TaxID=38323 RepID=UPI001F311399|nr:autotransporter outer membrane beta-barrel domain-containing protein [Bartonella henselae]